jgi:hypothetical protein
MFLKDKLYHFASTTLRLFADPVYRNQQDELRHDLAVTRREVGAWARGGARLVAENRHFGILSLTDLPMHAKFHCLVAKTMQLRDYSPVVFTYTGCRFAHSYYRLFGLDNLVMWDDVARPWGSPASGLDETVNALIPSELSISVARALTFRGVHVGEHALSLTCRKRIEGRLNLQDPETADMFRGYLKTAAQSVLAAESWLEQNPLDKLLVRDAGYIPSGPIFEVALQRGVDCVVLESGQRRSAWVFKRYTPATRGQHYFSLSASTWEEIKKQPWTATRDQALEREFVGRYSPDSVEDTRRLQSGKQILPAQEVCRRLGLDPQKKTAVIFSHVAWDAAFFFGSGLFDDFEDWLFQTVQFVVNTPECRQMNWIVKEHPFNVFKLQRETIKVSSEQRLLRPLMPLPEHVCFVPADTEINTQSLFSLADCVLTVNGTVGMEFPCYGIPALIAGSGRYDGYGFTTEPPTRAAYFEKLRTLSNVQRLDPAIRELARKHFYALMVGKQVSFEDVAPMELKRIHEAQSDVHDNISIRARSLNDLCASPSLNLLADWLEEGSQPDLLGPLA